MAQLLAAKGGALGEKQTLRPEGDRGSCSKLRSIDLKGGKNKLRKNVQSDCEHGVSDAGPRSAAEPGPRGPRSRAEAAKAAPPPGQAQGTRHLQGTAGAAGSTRRVLRPQRSCQLTLR